MHTLLHRPLLTGTRPLRVPLPLSPNTDKTGQLVVVCSCSPHSLPGAASYDTMQHHHTTRHSPEIHISAYPGPTLPSARFRLPPRVLSCADPIYPHTTTTCEVEQHGHKDHKRAPEFSGNGDAKGAPLLTSLSSAKGAKTWKHPARLCVRTREITQIRASNMGPRRRAETDKSMIAHLIKSIRIRNHTYLGLTTGRCTT